MPQGVRMASGPGPADRAPSRYEPPSKAASPARSLRPVQRLGEPPVDPLDCSECGSAGSVHRAFCEVCYADVDRVAPILHPSIPLRFSDVIEELRAIANLALEDADTPRGRVAAACRRAESLLMVLRRQFLDEVVFGEAAPST